MRLIYASLIILSIQTSVFGQSNHLIKGKITLDATSSIPNAIISLNGTKFTTVTNNNGEFEIKDVPFGKYVATVYSFETDTFKTDIEINEKTSYINIDKKSNNVNNLNEVVIEHKTVKRQMEVSGFAVSVIETKEAALRNMTTNELLDKSVGIRIRQNGGEGSPIEYNLNGMSGNAIGIFIDGIDISTYGSSFNLNTIPPSMIERIEVFKGVLPAHLSGNYIGGAINVIMKKSSNSNNIYLATSYGSFNTFKTDISGFFRNQNNGLTARFSAFYNYSDNDYEMWGKFSKYTLPGGRIIRNYRTKRSNDKFETIGGRIELGYTNVKWADQFLIGFNISDSYKEVPHGITMTKPYFGRYNEYQANVLSLNYLKNDFLIKGLSFNVNAVKSQRVTYLQDTVSLKYNWDGSQLVKNSEGEPEYYGYDSTKGQQGDAVISEITRNIYNLRTNLAYNIYKGHRLSVNYKLESTKRTDKDLLHPEKTPWMTKNNVATHIWAFNYETVLFKDRFKSNLFFKNATNINSQSKPITGVLGDISYAYEENKRSNQSYGGTLSYELIKQGFLIASAEKSFIMPTDRHINGEPENNLLANPDILPEVSVNYNLGFRYSINDAKKSRVSFYGNFFLRNGFDKIIQQTRTEPVIDGRENQVEDIQTTQFVNLSKTQSIGFEGEVNYSYGNKFNANINFSKFNSLFKLEKDEQGNPHSLYNKQVPNEPFFTVNGNFQYQFKGVFHKNGFLNLYYGFGYVGSFSTIWYKTDWFDVPVQVTNDLGVNYRFPNKKLILSLDCKNMFNAEIYDNFGVQKPGRAFYFKINYTLNYKKQ